MRKHTYVHAYQIKDPVHVTIHFFSRSERSEIYSNKTRYVKLIHPAFLHFYCEFYYFAPCLKCSKPKTQKRPR